MKKQFCYSVLSLAFAMFAVSANAQSGNSDIVKVTSSPEISATNSNETLKTETVKPTSTAEVNFENSFPGAKEVKWTKIENGLLVTCVIAGQKTSAAYNNNGKMNYSITNLNEANIPTGLGRLIKKDFSDYVVIKAIEVNNGGNISNQVILKSDKKFVIIKSNGDDIDVETVDNATAVK